MIVRGIKASELIRQLEDAVKKHGDLYVFTGGSDYPSGVGKVVYRQKGDAYVPKNTLEIVEVLY